MSSITRSGLFAAAIASARLPCVATFTTYPRSRSIPESSVRFAGVSSTMSTLAICLESRSVSWVDRGAVSAMLEEQGFYLLEPEALDHLSQATAELVVEARDLADDVPRGAQVAGTGGGAEGGAQLLGQRRE